jgi:hypothetical protein
LPGHWQTRAKERAGGGNGDGDGDGDMPMTHRFSSLARARMNARGFVGRALTQAKTRMKQRYRYWRALLTILIIFNDYKLTDNKNYYKTVGIIRKIDCWTLYYVTKF